VKKVWVKPCSPVSLRIGTVSIPGAFMGMRKKLRPSYFRSVEGSVRARRIMYLA
jgi:hypothetical protein